MEKNLDVRAWGSAETRCLIAAWAEDTVQRKLGDSYRNRAVFEDIAKTMEDGGYGRSWLQCQRKIKHLKMLYRKAKDNKNSSGAARMSCPFFDEMDAVLRDRPAFCPGEGEILDSADSTCIEATVDAADGEREHENEHEHTSPAPAEGSDRVSEAPPPAPAPPPERRKRPTERPTGSRKKKSRFEVTLESFIKALSQCPEDPTLLQMQKAQHQHEKELFGMMMNQIATLAAAQHTPCPGHASPCCGPTPRPAPASEPSFERYGDQPHCSTAGSPLSSDSLLSSVSHLDSLPSFITSPASEPPSDDTPQQ